MLFKIDSLFGHVIEETAKGVVYQADGVLVDGKNLRPCVGCKVKCANGEQDPCIKNLPGTLNACCGHGLDVTPVNHNPNGYVSLEDGRTIRFSGLLGGERIRRAVDAALKGETLPEGFTFDENKMWWAGLTDSQRQYVQDNLVHMLAKLVTEVKNGEPPSPLFLKGEAMWYEELDEEQKALVWSRMGAAHDQLVQEALAQGHLKIA
jgi:hypothetical protein